MGSLGNINVAMQLDAVDFHRGMGGARAEVRTFGHDVDRMGSALRGVFAGLATGAAIHGLVSMAKQAAHVEEAVHGLTVAFGDQADEMESYVRRTSGAFKIGLGTLLDKTNQIGSFFSGAGFDDEGTAAFSRSILQAATNMQALKDVPISIALDKFSSALAGEYIPLRAFGIIMNEGAVATEAYRLGLARAGGELSEFAKMQARASLIVRGSERALGVAAEEADGAAAKIAGLSGAWENFSIQVGETFAPAVGEALGTASELLTALGGLWKENEAASKTWLTGLSAELGVATTGLGAMTEAAGLLADAGWMVNHAFTAVQSGVLGALGAGAGFLGGLMPENQANGIVGGGLPDGVGQFLRAFAEEAGGRVKAMDADFLKAWGAGRPSERLAKELERLRAQFAKTREELSKPEPLPLKKYDLTQRNLGPVGPDAFLGQAQAGFAGLGGIAGIGAIAAAAGGLAAKLASDPKFSKTRDFSPAMLRGSAEAAETILRSKYGAAQDPVAKNTKDAADVLKRIETQLEKAPGLPFRGDGGFKLVEIM